MIDEIDQIDQEDPLPLPKGFIATKKSNDTIPLPKGFEPLKKKINGISSLMQGAGSALGNGLSQSNGLGSEKQKVLDYMQGLKEKQPVTNIPQSAIENQVLPTKKKSRITDKEAEDEAIRRFNSPLSIYENIKGYQAGAGMNVPMNEDDPIGNRLSEIENEKNATINSYDPLSGKPDNEIYYLNEIDVKNKQAKLIKDYSIQDSNEAAYIVKKLADKNNGGDVGSLNNYSLEQIKASLPENNVTAKLAFEKYAKKRHIDEANNQYGSFDEMVARLYGGKEKSELSEAKLGQYIDQALNDPDIIEKTKESADFANKYRQAQFDLYKNYPSYGFKKVSEMISQKLEDKGMLGWLYSNPSLKKVETAIEYLKEDGVWGFKEEELFKEKLLPYIAADASDKVLTLPDAAHQFGYGVNEGAKGFEASGRDIINKLSGGFIDPSGNGLFQNLGLMEKNEDRAKRLEQEAAATPTVEPKRFATKLFGGAASFAGQMTPIILGNAVGIPNRVNLTMMFEGHNADKAREISKDVGVQNIYTLLTTTGDVFGMELLPTKKAASAFKSLFDKDVQLVIRDLADKKITQDVAKKTLTDKAMNYAKRLGMHNTTTAAVLQGYNSFHNGMEAALGGRKFNVENELNEALSNYPTNWLNSTFLSALAAHKGGEQPINGQMYKRLADNADYYRDIINKDNTLSPVEKQDRIDKLDHLEAINSLLVKRDLKKGQVENYLSKSMQQFVAQKAAKESADKVLAKEDERKAAIAEVEKEHILNPMSNTTLAETLFKHLPKGSQEKLSTEGKFDKTKVTPYLEYIAKQSNGLDDNWKPHEDGRIPKMTGIPESVIRAANEKFAKEIESSQEPIKEETGTASTVSVVDGGDVVKLNEDANKILSLHDNGVNFDLFDNNKLRQIAKDNGIDLPEGTKNADIIKALKDKQNGLGDNKTEAQSVNESIGTSDNTETILETAEKKGGIYSQLAKAVKNLLGGVKTTVTNAFKSDVSEHGDYGQNEIRINNKTDKNKLHIFFHEALHHITRGKIEEFESNPNSKNLKPQEVEAILNLKRIFKNVTEKLNKDAGGFGTQKGGQSPTNLWLLDATGNKRGLANVHEFISEAFTNPEFQKLLKDFKGEGKQPNLFKQFLDAVAKMLGLKDPTILDDIFHHTEKLAEPKEQSTKVEEQDGGEQPVEVYKDVPIYKDKDGNYFVEDKKGNKSTFAVMDGAMGVKKAIDSGEISEDNMYLSDALTNPETANSLLETIASQAQGEVAPEFGDAKEAMVRQFGKTLVNEAIAKYPKLEKQNQDIVGEPEQISQPIELSIEIPESEKGFPKVEYEDAVETTNVDILEQKNKLTEQKDAEVKEAERANQQSQQQATQESQPDESTTEKGEGAGKEPPTGEEVRIIEDREGEDLSGIKKALVSDEIIKGVDLNRIGYKDAMKLGRKILDTGEVKPEALVTKIITEGKGVLTPTEVVGLITYKRDIDTAANDLYAKYNEKVAAGEDTGTLGVEISNLERQINDFEVMSVITAQQQSLAFGLRQMMLDRDYNAVMQIAKYKKNNNGYIPPEVEAKFRELEKELKEVKAKLSEAEKKEADKEGQESVDNIKESVDREKKYTDEEIEKKVQEGVEKEINSIYEQLPSEKKSYADKAISAIRKFREKIRKNAYSDATGMVAIVDTGLLVAERAIKLGVEVAKAIEIGVKKIRDLMAKKGIKQFDEARFREDAKQFFEENGVSLKKVKDKPTINEDGSVSIPNEMLRDLVERGVTDINDLTDAVHKEVVKDLPDVTTRQVRDYITEYGKKVNPTADEIQQQVNTAKRVGRLLSELEDLQNKKRKENNPSTRAKLTEKERELKRQISSLEKSGDIPETAEEKNLKRLEKKLNNLLSGEVENTKEKRELSEKENELNDQIADAKKNLGLIRSKNTKTDNSHGLKDLEAKEQSKIKALEKQLSDLKQGVVKEKSEKTEDSAGVKDLKEQIYEAKKNLGLIGSKNTPSTPNQLKITETERKIERLEKEKADLESGIVKQRGVSEKPSPAQQEKIDVLKDEIFELKKNLGVIKSKEIKEPLTEADILNIAKSRVKSRIAELERKIRNKNFAKPVKKVPPTDTELADLTAKKEKLQEEFDNEQYKLQLKNRTGWQKAEDVALEATSGLVRGLVASLDVSATFVQGTFRLMVDLGKSTWQLARLKKPSPNRSLIAIKDMLRSLVSQKYADNYLNGVKGSEKYPLMKASKLAIDDKAGHVSAKEGFFISNWINLIWNHALAPTFAMPISIFTKGNVRKAYDIAKAINPYLASQRAFDGYVNSIRVSSFKDFAKSLENDGYSFEADPKVFQKAADVINTTTGRGSLGAADASSRWLNIFLFAPRKVVSEVKLFTPYAFAYYAKMPKPVRVKALKDLGIFLASFTTANALVWASNKPDEDDKEGMKIWEDFWNPNSSNFLTHKIGDKRVSIGGGAKSMIVFQSRLFTGKFTDQYGKTTELGDRFGKQINTRFDLITNFIAGKSSPIISVGVRKAQERKGLEVDDAELMRDVTVPIWMQDLKEMYKHDPTTVNAILTAFSIFGANVRPVDPDKQSQGNTINLKYKNKKDEYINRDATIEENKKYEDEKVKETNRMLSEYEKGKKVTINRYGEVSLKSDSKGKEVDYNKLTETQQKELLSSIKESAGNYSKSKLLEEVKEK